AHNPGHDCLRTRYGCLLPRNRPGNERNDDATIVCDERYDRYDAYPDALGGDDARTAYERMGRGYRGMGRRGFALYLRWEYVVEQPAGSECLQRFCYHFLGDVGLLLQRQLGFPVGGVFPRHFVYGCPLRLGFVRYVRRIDGGTGHDL